MLLPAQNGVGRRSRRAAAHGGIAASAAAAVVLRHRQPVVVFQMHVAVKVSAAVRPEHHAVDKVVQLVAFDAEGPDVAALAQFFQEGGAHDGGETGAERKRGLCTPPSS